MSNYAIFFAGALSLSVALIIAGIFIGKKIKWKGRKSERHLHNRDSLRVGGIAVAMTFFLVIIANKDIILAPNLMIFLAASMVVALIGFLDDIKELSWKTQLFLQSAVAGGVFFAGLKIHYVANPFTEKIILFDSAAGVTASFFLVVIWIILMMNSMNWLDGIDGLSGGVTFISAVTIFFLSLKPEVNQPPMAIMAIILAGASLGFLFFNFNPSRVLAGTAGSMFMGFALAILAILSGTKIATATLVMAVPLVDFIRVIGERIKNKKSIFAPDQSHLHHKLLRLGWSQKKIILCFYAITVFISFIALNTRALGKGAVFLVIFVSMYFFMRAIDKKLKTVSTEK